MKILFRNKQKIRDINESRMHPLKEQATPQKPTIQEWDISMADLMPSKTDDEILEESVQLIQKTKQLLSEDWASRWLPRWLGGGSNETPDWIPNILGPGSLIAPGEGINLKDSGPQYISPEMMDVIQRNNPGLDLSTREGFEAAMKQGGMTGEQAKAETEEYFQTGMAGAKTAAALALLLPAAAAAAPTAGAGAAGAGAAGEVAAGTALRTGATAAARTGGSAALRTGGGAVLRGAPRIGTPAVRAAMQRLSGLQKIGTGAVTKNAGRFWRGAPWAKNLYSNHYGKYMIFEFAAAELAPEFYDKYLKYVDPFHYAIQALRAFKIMPYIGDESPPIWFGRDPANMETWLGLEEYMPWYENSVAEGDALVEEMTAAGQDLVSAMERGDEAAAAEANQRRKAVEEKMKEHSAKEYNEWIELSEKIDEQLAAGDLGDTTELTEHGPENPAVYAYGTEAEKAHYEQLKQNPDMAGGEEFLNHYTYGGGEE
jgi:hypothetical protein